MQILAGASRVLAVVGVAVLLVISTAIAVSASVPVWFGQFSDSNVSAWQEHRFSGKTHYELRESGSGIALYAESRGTASAFYREMRIDLRETPVIHWRWRVDSGPAGLDERSKRGDDYAARVYVVHKRGFLRKPYAVNYVWSGSQPRGATWPNAWLPKHSGMVAVRGTEDHHGRWYQETRNVREDFKRLVGVDVDVVDVVVLMSDTDNQRGFAQAWYGDSFFDVR